MDLNAVSMVSAVQICLNALHQNAFFTPNIVLARCLPPGPAFFDAADQEEVNKNKNRDFISLIRIAYFAA
jgi:hypothetical protein